MHFSYYYHQVLILIRMRQINLTFKNHFVFLCHLPILFFNKQIIPRGKHLHAYTSEILSRTEWPFLTYIFWVAWKGKRQISPRSLWHFKWLCKLFCVFFMINVKHTSLFTLLFTNKLFLFCCNESFYYEIQATVISYKIIENKYIKILEFRYIFSRVTSTYNSYI